MAGYPHMTRRGSKLCALALLGLLGACGQPQTQLPDLSLRFDCNADTARTIEPEIDLVTAERASNDSTAAGVHEIHVKALKQRLAEAGVS